MPERNALLIVARKSTWEPFFGDSDGGRKGSTNTSSSPERDKTVILRILASKLANLLSYAHVHYRSQGEKYDHHREKVMAVLAVQATNLHG